MSDFLPINSDWQSNGNLSDSLWYMQEKQIMCDVVFEVGKEYERIGAHTSVLAARSTVFFKQFSTAHPLREIELENTNPKHFRLFLQYLYRGHVNLDDSDNEGVLAIADRYQVTRLTEMILPETLRFMTTETFCAFVSEYDTFSTEKQACCLQYSFNDPVGLFNCPKFVELPYSFLKDLLGHEYLEMEEDAICTAVLLWATKACENKKMEVNGENQRTVLEEILHLVRFPLLSQDYFTENISEKELLTPTEEVQLLKFFLNPRTVLKSNFKTVERKAPTEPYSLDSHKSSTPSFTSLSSSLSNNNQDQHGAAITGNTSKDKSSNKHSSPTTSTTLTPQSVKVTRFKGQGQGWGYRGNKKDAVAFTSSKDVELESVFVYGSTKEISNMDVDVTIKDMDGHPFTTKAKIENTKSQPVYEITLDQVVKVKANATCHIIVTLNTDTGFYGKGGRSSVKMEDVTIHFMRSKFSSNNTTEGIGQIPGFKFKIVK